LSVQAGTATSTRRRGQENAYNFITIERDQVSIEVRAWNGTRFWPMNTNKFIRIRDIWQLVEQ
ncbi:MAG TPA: hypothetical protein VKK61_04355, partial [Tepidisphaeraceae bacterium]|nr:hypothetical protein [Tepidisphaeraceae bacterium]